MRDKKHRIKVRCSCGYTFELNLEFRRNFRKKTDFPGNCTFEKDTRNIRVIDLSISGACFEVRSPHDIKPGMEGELLLTLDNRKMSSLYRKVVIRTVNGNRIGCEFLDSNTPSRELGFYMMPTPD
nr:PilZ domain-containing protein [Desulforhopalus vacuolatus]